MTSFSYEIKECPNCNLNYLAVKVRSFNSFGAKHYTDGSMSNSSVRAENFLVCPKCSTTEWAENVKTIKNLSERDYIELQNEYTKDRKTFLQAIPEFSGLSASNILLLINDEPWNCQEQERYLRINLWRAVGRLHLKRESRTDRFCTYLEEQVSRYADSQPLKVAEALNDLGRQEECMDCLESHPLSNQLEENMIRLLELSKDSPLILAELLRQLGRFSEATEILSDAYPASENAYVKKITELAVSGNKWLGEVT